MKKYIALFALVFAITAFAATAPIGGFLKVELAKYDPVPAEAGKTVTIWIKAENAGTEPFKDTRLTLKVDYPFSLPNNDPVRNYGSISAGDDVLLEYKLFVDVNAPNGTHKMKIIYGSGESVTAEKEFELTVSEKEKGADLKARFVRLDPAAYPGGTSGLTLDIVNRNPGTAYFTTVKIDSPVAIVERNEVYVGNLESDDFDSVDFDLKIKNDVQPGQYPINLLMNYKDEDSDAFQKTDTIMINVVSASQANAGTQSELPILNIVISIIVLLILIRLAVPMFHWIVKPFRRKK